MKKNFFYVLLGLVTLSTGCAQFKNYAESRAILEDEARVFVKPVVADLVVEESRRTWSVTFSRKETILYGNTNNLCRYACWVATRNGDQNSPAAFDAIVAPTYVVKPSKRQTVVEITGYPANFRNFKNVTEDDKDILRFSINPFFEKQIVPVVPCCPDNNK